MSEDKLRDAHMALKRKDKAITQLKTKEQRLNALRERVTAVRNLHQPDINEAEHHCRSCHQEYPCPTIEALEGEK